MRKAAKGLLPDDRRSVGGEQQQALTNPPRVMLFVIIKPFQDSWMSPVRRRAFSLVEVVLSLGIATLTIGGIITGYLMSSKRVEWSAYSLAAHSLALQRIEQARAARWDPSSHPPIDELVSANFVPAVEVLDIPVTGTNIVFATNFTTIITVSTSPLIKRIRVDCAWPFLNDSVFTNTIVTYRAPDQ
jgi:type II secretory pathway pseudopilin PulG